jgi:hypothetical protein
VVSIGDSFLLELGGNLCPLSGGNTRSFCALGARRAVAPVSLVLVDPTKSHTYANPGVRIVHDLRPVARIRTITEGVAGIVAMLLILAIRLQLAHLKLRVHTIDDELGK